MRSSKSKAREYEIFMRRLLAMLFFVFGMFYGERMLLSGGVG